MEKEISLLRIPLQFFGESGDDFEDDFEYEDEASEDNDAPEDEDGDDGDGNADDAADGGSEGGKKEDHAELLADLRALGFKGESLEDIKASVKARREAKEKSDKSEERRAAQAEGKSHIKGSKPRKGADGSRAEGVSERHVRALSETIKSTPQRARTLLEKHSRLINGG